MKTKSKNFKNKLIGSILGVCALAMIVTPVATIATAEPSNADVVGFTSATNSSFSVKMFNKSHEEIAVAGNSIIVESNAFTVYSTDWKDLSRFEIEFNGDIPEGEVYNYQYSVTWTPLEIKEESLEILNDNTEIKSIVSGKTSDKEEIPSKVTFYIELAETNKDANIYYGNDVLGESYIKHGGWGIYQFSFNCNNSVSSSDLFEVKTTKLSDIPDAVFLKKHPPIRSQYSIDNAYIFTIEGDEFKYIDRSLIKWMVSGEGSDGKKYVLRPSDIPENNTSLKSLLTDESDDYYSTSFKFDFDVSGSWNISCVISDGETTKESNVLPISTVEVIKQSTIIWIVVGSVAGAAVLLTLIIVLTKKKERIW